MNGKRLGLMFCVLVVLAAGGCGLGYNRMLFFTTTNYGLNLDSTPPTAEVDVGRREGVISPAFDGDTAPPVLGMFKSDGGFFDPALSGVFSGGSAAILVAEPVGPAGTPTPTITGTPPPTPTEKAYCVKDPPTSAILSAMSGIPFLGALTEEKDSVRPFIFATDTMTGLKAAWSGAGGAFPDTVKFGYNRKELAYAPVFGQPSTAGATGTTPTPTTTPGKCDPGQKEVKMPSFLATIFDATSLSTREKSGLRYVQLFATGRAADRLAARSDVRRLIEAQMFPKELVAPSPTSPPESTPTATP